MTRVANPHLPITETDSYGTVAMEKNIEAKWNFALNAAFPNQLDRDDAIAPDLGLGREVLNQLIFGLMALCPLMRRFEREVCLDERFREPIFRSNF